MTRTPTPSAGGAWRLLAERKSSPIAKLFLVAAVLYVLMPLDLIPDVAVVVGWLDDLAVITLALSTLLVSLMRSKPPAQVPVVVDARPRTVVETTGVRVDR